MKHVFKINWDAAANTVSVKWYDQEQERYVAKQYPYDNTNEMPYQICRSRLKEFINNKTTLREPRITQFLEYSPSEFIAIIEVQ